MKKILLLFTLFTLLRVNAQESGIEQDSLALVAFYNSTNGDSWITNDHWLSGELKDWYGIRLENGRVSTIVLSANGLSGALPYDLGKLSELKYLYLSYNTIEGTMPTSIGDMKHLEVVWAQFNKFSGTLPTSMGQLEQLKTLNLSNNLFTGNLPDEIGNLSMLELLNLQHNTFVGSLPESLGQLSKLKYLNLDHCKFSGEVPLSFQNLSALKCLTLDNNYLSVMPDLSMLSHLDNSSSFSALTMQNNYFDFTDIKPNLNILLTKDNYSPQRIFLTGADITLYPGDTVNLNMPAQTNMNLSDTSTVYTYLRDKKPLQKSKKQNVLIESATASDLGKYSCSATNVNVPGLSLVMKSVSLVLRTDSTWLSLGTYLDDKLTDTISYVIEAYLKTDSGFDKEIIEPVMVNKRTEMMIPAGDYYFKIVPDEASYMAMYTSNKTQWFQDDLYHASTNGVININAEIFPESEAEGNGEISGRITWKDLAPAERSFSILSGEGTRAFENADIYLFGRDGNTKQYHERSGDDGIYSFNHLEVGSYQLVIDYPGYRMIEDASIEVHEGEMQALNVNYTLLDSAESTVGFELAANSESEMKVYPNPSQGDVFVESRLFEGQSVNVKLYDISGRVMFDKVFVSAQGILRADLKSMSRKKLKAGQYILEIKLKEKILTERILLR